MVKDALGDRMKKYEYVSRTYLMPRTPVIIRLDGKAFHTFTQGFKKPFDMILIKTMQETMKYLCENIQGCVLGYTQSDEITLVLVDYKKINSCAWFDYNIQKCVSVVASMATMKFNQEFSHQVRRYKEDKIREHKPMMWDSYKDFYYQSIYKAMTKCAMFDARAFNIPKEEVTNCILWRQNDATRNSIQMVGHANFSQNQLHKKSCNEIQDMLMLQKGINWNDFPTTLKRGSCCRRIVVSESDGGELKSRSKWIIDNEIPIFKGDNRAYIDELIFIGESA